MAIKLSPLVWQTGVGWAVWCTACGHVHIFHAKRPDRPNAPSWTFDGNAEAPTFDPSMLLFQPEHKNDEGVVEPRKTICHSFVRRGHIEYLNDCAHSMAGQTVPLQPIPEDYGLS